MDAAQLALDDASLRDRLELPRVADPRRAAAHGRPGGTSEAERERTEAAVAFVGDLKATAMGEARFLIACCKTKRAVSAPAAELYASPLFVRSAELARRLGIPMSILSAKHGLIPAELEIEPYDQTLKTCSAAERREWAERVASSARSDLAPREHLILLAGSTYSNELVPMLEAGGWTVSRPLAGMALGERLSFLNRTHRVLDRREAVERFYGDMARLAARSGLMRLPDLLKGDLPARGVYFFFDPDEATPHGKAMPRLVRVGTHAVSAGSKASLRTRLRAHLGTAAGLGNHRSSVFRLHVGEAMSSRDGSTARFPSWGSGQSAGAEVIGEEAELEREVSRYISRLLVLCLDVDDEPGKGSMRAVIERHSIALFTESRAPLDPPSANWLGSHSRQVAIRGSGLWNVRAVGERADLQVVGGISRWFGDTPAGG